MASIVDELERSARDPKIKLSLKRHDIAVYYAKPAEQGKALTLLPEVVIEIVSAGYEKKDTDIVIFDPATNRVFDHHNGQTDEYDSPMELTFAYGCRATI